jgi:ABC-2 type transport system ATP-binding protein
VGKEKTVMLSTHIMQEVEAICDRVIIIHNGRIVKDGKASEIRSALGNEIQVITVEFDKDVEARVLSSIPEIQNLTKVSSTTWMIEGQADKQIREALFQFAVNNSLMVLSMQKKEKRLEDIFRELTS